MPSLHDALAQALGRTCAAKPPEDHYFNPVVRLSKKYPITLALMVSKKEVPSGFQIRPLGASAHLPERKVSRAKSRFFSINLASMLATCSVHSVNIVDCDKMVKVYINLEVDDERLGFDSWIGYAPFIEKLCTFTWEKCAVQFEEGKTFVNFAGKYYPKQEGDSEISFEQKHVLSHDFSGEALDSQGRTWPQVLRDEDSRRAEMFGA